MTEDVKKYEAKSALSKFQEDTQKIWSDKNKIRKLLPATLTTDEFDFFMSLGSALGANPFTREIWAVKYDIERPAAIFCGRDFYRRRSQELFTYDGHYAESVYSNDQFSVKDGVPEHKFNFMDRGNLVGAYCIVYKKDVKHPFFMSVKYSEYNKKQSIWNSSPETMIKKVAEAQALRGAFQGVFQGTYDESEKWEDTKAEVVDNIDMTKKPEAIEKPKEEPRDDSTELATKKEIDDFNGYMERQDLLEFLPPEAKDLVVEGFVTKYQLKTMMNGAKAASDKLMNS